MITRLSQPREMNAMRRWARRARGLSMVEALISLAAAASLLTSAAAAFNASATAIEKNERMFRASQTARVAMNQILTAVRRCEAAEVDGDATLNMFREDGADVSYAWNEDAGQILYITNDIATDVDGVLARNITAADFSQTLEPDPDTGIDRVVQVTLTLTVEIDGAKTVLTGSASPRKARVYDL